MTIETREGDLLSVPQGYIVHGCNAQGVMGSGVALQIKEQMIKAYNVYVEYIAEMIRMEISPMGTNTYAFVTDDLDLLVVNAITQDFFGRQEGMRYADYDAIRNCFKGLNNVIKENHFTLTPKIVHFPKIGAGLGGGDWAVIEKIIDEELDDSIEKVLWVYNG